MVKNKLYFALSLSIITFATHAKSPAIPVDIKDAEAVEMTNIAQPSTNSAQQQNKQAVLAFYEAGLNQKDFAAASKYLGPYYKQHNSNAADGIEGFRNFVSYLKEKVPTSHSEIKLAFADGDFVILHVHKTTSPTDRGVAIVDIFRLEQGKIVEHWDVTQAIPEKTASGNPMF